MISIYNTNRNHLPNDSSLPGFYVFVSGKDKEEKEGGATMNRIMAMILVLAMAIAFCGCGGCDHEFSAATCTTPATCSKCGESNGEPLGHDWVDATCTEPKTCLQCGITTGQALGHRADHPANCTEPSICSTCGAVLEEATGHQWEEATCIKRKTCSVCGAEEGDFAAHKFEEATCIAPKTCSVCGFTEGEVSSEHAWVEATCTEPQTCSRCGATEGKALGHDWKDATCTQPKTCKRCNETEGDARGHRTGNWEVTLQATKDKAGTRVKKCSVCGEIVEKESFTLTNEELLKQYKKDASYSYNDLARNPNMYTGTYVFFTGKVVQVCSEASSSLYYSTYRVATKGSYDNVVYVYIDNYGTGSRILEGDTISFYGKYDGLYTYTTVMGSSITIPSIKVEVYCQGTVY